MEEINIKDFLQYLKKYTILIIVLVCLFLGITFIYDSFIKKDKFTTYTTIVLVKDDSNAVNVRNYTPETINQTDIQLNQKLVSTYSQIIKSKLVLQQVIDKLNLNYSIDKINKEVVVEALDDTEILRISVTDGNSEMSANIANTISEVFESEITKIYNINNISVIDKAEVPKTPSNSSLVRDLIIAILAAGVVGVGTTFIIFYFDDTLRSVDLIDNEISLPLIAKVFKDTNKIDLLVENMPKSFTSESIRTLRANLQFSSIDTELKTLLVTSTMPNEGKSFVSANLATAFAQSGKKVLLIDCDLRKGRQGEIFGIVKRKGLSNLLVSDIEDYEKYISKTKVKNLFLLPRGSFPPNPSELLSSKKNANLINLLKEKFDMIILDGAPCNDLSDSIALSTIVDNVILISSINHTPIKELKNVIKSLEKVGAHIAGIVVNNIPFKKHSYGSHYYNYSYNYGYGYYGEKEKTK